MTKLYDHACGLMIVPTNPCVGIKLSAIKGARPPVKKRVMLEQHELEALLSDIDFIGRENALAFRILLATCVRGAELIKAKKSHIDLERANWWVPEESVKTRNSFLVPLPGSRRLVRGTDGAFRRLAIFTTGASSGPRRPARRRAADAPRFGRSSTVPFPVATSTFAGSPRMTPGARPRATCETSACPRRFPKWL